MNIVEEVYSQAKKENWCTKMYCTTCGSKIFRREAEKSIEADTHKFINDLKTCNFSVLDQKQDWVDGLFLIFHNIPIHTRGEILEEWLIRQDISGRQYDYLFFYLVRLSKNEILKDKWTRRLTDIARRTKDTSLIESLLIDLKQQVKLFPELCELVENEFINDPKIKKLYKK